MLELDEVTRGIDAGCGLKTGWDYCFEASERLRTRFSWGEGHIATCSVSVFNLAKNAPLENVIKETERKLKEAPTMEQRSHNLTAESVIPLMDESIIGRIASFNRWYGKEFLGGPPAMLVFMDSHGEMLPVLMKFDAESEKCYSDIAEGEIPYGTKVIIARNQRVQQQ